MIGHIVRSVDFERVLRAPIRARTSHFALHHLADAPSRPGPVARTALVPKLSTGHAPEAGAPVDDSVLAGSPAARWLGTVVPKKHARRAVTRSLLKRQIRAAIGRQTMLGGGLWVVRLRAPFVRDQFPSAASKALGEAARTELDTLLAAAVRRAAA